MKQCLRPKCGKSFEPATPKQVYCSDNCRKYHNKELKRTPIEQLPVVKALKEAVKLTKRAGTIINRELPPAGLDKAATLKWFKSHIR